MGLREGKLHILCTLGRCMYVSRSTSNDYHMVWYHTTIQLSYDYSNEHGHTVPFNLIKVEKSTIVYQLVPYLFRTAHGYYVVRTIHLNEWKRCTTSHLSGTHGLEPHRCEEFSLLVSSDFGRVHSNRAQVRRKAKTDDTNTQPQAVAINTADQNYVATT